MGASSSVQCSHQQLTISTILQVSMYVCCIYNTVSTLEFVDPIPNYLTLLGEQDFKSPIKFVFRPHHGPVYGICCSPFHRNLFLSCSTDASARLYSLLDVRKM